VSPLLSSVILCHFSKRVFVFFCFCHCHYCKSGLRVPENSYDYGIEFIKKTYLEKLSKGGYEVNPALSSSHEKEWLGLSDLLDAQRWSNNGEKQGSTFLWGRGTCDL